MLSLPASPGADSLAADSSRPGASIPQGTFLAFGLGAHPSCCQPSPHARRCCQHPDPAAEPPPSPAFLLLLLLLPSRACEQPAELCLQPEEPGLVCPLSCSPMAENAEVASLEESFRKFAIYGDTKATGQEMNGKNWAKLCKDCKVTDGKSVTSTDVDIVFSKVK